MALADYCLCHNCYGKAFYDANISDERYTATWDLEAAENTLPIGLAVLCAACNETHECVIIERKAP
jgi:hypothetical protein